MILKQINLKIQIMLFMSLFLLNFINIGKFTSLQYETFPIITVFILGLIFLLSPNNFLKIFLNKHYLKSYLIIIFPTIIMLLFNESLIFLARYTLILMIGFFIFKFLNNLPSQIILKSIIFILFLYILIALIQSNEFTLNIFCSFRDTLNLLPRGICGGVGTITILSPEPSYHTHYLFFIIVLFEFYFSKNKKIIHYFVIFLIYINLILIKSDFAFAVLLIYTIYNFFIFFSLFKIFPILLIIICAGLFFNYKNIYTWYQNSEINPNTITISARTFYNKFAYFKADFFPTRTMYDFADKLDVNKLIEYHENDILNEINYHPVLSVDIYEGGNLVPSSSLAYNFFNLGYLAGSVWLIIFFSNLVTGIKFNKFYFITILYLPYLITAFFFQLNFAMIPFWYLYFILINDKNESKN